MASEKKLILVFIELIALIGINLGYEKPCNVSTSTIEIVQTCPTDEKSYKEAADRKNCAAIPNHCESFVYHCVRNKEKNALIEVCAPWLNIIGQVCGTYDEGFMSIKRREKESCMNFTNTCPWHYNSTEQFKYPGCYEVGKTEPQEKNKSSNGEIIAGVFVAVTCIIIFILIIMYISHVRNKKRKSKSYLRGNNPNIAEAQLTNQSNFSEPNIDNVTTAGNEMSRDQNEYLIPDSQVSINTADDNYIGQFIPTSLPSSVAQQVTSTDQDLSPETFSLTSSSTATEINLTKDRDIATAGDVHLNALFTELDGRAGTFPYQDRGATSQLQDPDMITFGGSVSDIIEEVKKVLDGAKSRLDSSVRKTCKQKLKEAEKNHQKELDMIRKQIKAENRKLRRQISEQQTQLCDKDRKISRQDRDIEEKDRKITGIARQLQESHSQTNEIKDKLKEKEQELVEMRKEISRLNDEISKL